MFDRGFDEPNYDIGGGYDQTGYNDTYSQNQGPDKKKIIKFAVIGIVLLVIVGIIFTILNSNQTFNFELKELDSGKLIPETLTILNESGDRVYTGRDSVHTVTLPYGNYTYRLTNPIDHKPISNILVVDGSGDKTRTIIIPLEKDIDAKLDRIFNFDKIYPGQTVTGNLTITNTGNTLINDVLILTNNDFFDVKLIPEKITVSPQGATGVDFEIKIKSNNNVTASKKESIEFRLASTNASTSISLDVIPAVKARDVVVSGGGIRSGSLIDTGLTTGQTKTVTFSIKNNNKIINMENVLIEIIPDIGFENKLNWFEFLGYQEEKSKILINRIEADKSINITFNITPPINEEVNSRFNGAIKISSLSIEEDIRTNMQLTISKKLEASLSLTGTLTYSSKCTLGQGCTEIDTSLGKTKIRNTSKDLEIKNIKLSILEDLPADDVCTLWITLNETEISSLKAGETANIVWKIEPTDDATARFNSCYISWTYDDPINVGEKVTDKGEVKIQVTTN